VSVATQTALVDVVARDVTGFYKVARALVE
jgi:hypothetical protein